MKTLYNSSILLTITIITVILAYKTYYRNLNLYWLISYAILTLIHAIIYYCFSLKRHEKAHWKEAEKYHKLINPRITSAHFDCDNWGEFSLEEARNVALAGIQFDKKFNAWFLLLAFLQPLTIIFTVATIFGNAIPIKFSKNSATDGYWAKHPEEFLESKRQC